MSLDDNLHTAALGFKRDPASPYFKEGVDAFADEICIDACPYEDLTEAWFQWGEGWEHAEFQDSRDAADAVRDRRLDDQHRRAA